MYWIITKLGDNCLLTLPGSPALVTGTILWILQKEGRIAHEQMVEWFSQGLISTALQHSRRDFIDTRRFLDIQ